MKLVLEDGSTFPGTGFGALAGVAGEVVFNTAMSGYVETLTDPSYRGQILVLTYPLIGNYGVPPRRNAGEITGPYESDRLQIQGLIVQNYSRDYSHHAATRSLADWLIEEDIPAVTGVDTRALTRHLRAAGTMKGRLFPDDAEGFLGGTSLREVDMHREVFRQVAPASVARFGGGDTSILLVDVGAKDNIVRSLLKRGVTVIRAPWHDDLLPYYDEADGVLIGNGPCDPADLEPLIGQVRAMLETGDKPVMGICLGNQILARAAGARTFKLPYGHRGVNQPVQDLVTRRCFITSQNHGYAVDNGSLADDWEPWFVNLNDGSNEGIRSKTRPYFGVQFHPEAHPGPEDTGYLFDEFIRSVQRPIFA
jgi:carbamoyl-phosphate synthase small subunit